MSILLDNKHDITVKRREFDGTTEDIDLCIKYDNKYLVPFLYGKSIDDKVKNVKKYDSEFYGSLRDYQIDDYKRAIHELNKNKCTFLCLPCGYGKTIMGVKIACKLGLKTLILVDQTLIKTGWIKTVEDVTNIQISELHSKIGNSQFIITHIINLKKFSVEELSIFDTVIVDEALYFMTEKRMKLLMKLTPKYLIGMCAEIKRNDNLHQALYYFFCNKKNMIISDMIRQVKLYVIQTTFKPTVVYKRYGKDTRPDWNTVLNSIALDEDRTKMICNIVKLFRKEKCIVVSKRKKQAEYIHRYLCDNYVDAGILIEKDKKFKNCNILISTYSKLFKGFDAERCCENYDNKPYRIIFIISDVVKPEQLVGRVMRSHNPIVYYFLDDYSKLRKHYLEFEKYFRKKLDATIVKEWLI